MQKVVRGQIVQVEPRQQGWVAVHISIPGKQYPVKVSTKRPDLVNAAGQMMGQFVDALYNEEQSTTINPHNQQPYTNRYLEQLAPGGSIPEPQPGFGSPAGQLPVMQPGAAPTQAWPQQQPAAWAMNTPAPPPQAQPQVQYSVTDDERENRIMRQAATKVAAAFLPMLKEEDRNLGALIRIAEQLLKYYREGVSWETYPPQMPQQVPGGDGYGYGDPGPEQGDPGGYETVPGELPPGY